VQVAVRLVAVLVGLALGLLVGVVGAFQHLGVLTVAGDIRLPVGLVAALAALVLAQILMRDTLPLGLGAAVVFVGWLVAATVMGTSRAEGDLAVAAGWQGATFLYGGFVLGAGVAARASIGAARREAEERASEVASSGR
jgi:hypothetical protein